MQNSQVRPTIDRHIERFKGTNGEREWFDKVLRFYNGDPWGTGDKNTPESDLLKTSTNLIFAITDTALSSLVPPNPQVSATPRNRANAAQVIAAEDIVNLSFKAGHYRRELGSTVFSGVLYGRGIGKTLWNAATDMAVTRSIDPRNLFFDQVATRPEDIRYWIEVTLIGEREFQKRIEKGQYGAKAKDYTANTFPTWMLPDEAASGDYDEILLKNYQKWHVVYEVYDIEEGKVYHCCPDVAEPIFEDNLLYNPYDILTFNDNGRDCRGLSEIGLILPNQEEYNLLSTYLLNIVRYQVSRMGYDHNAFDGDLAVLAQTAPLGSLTPMGIKPELYAQGVRAKDCIFELPTPHAQIEQMDLLNRLREGIAYVSAIADAQRGQVVGAKTATELALIEGQLRNRLRSRQGRIDEFTASAAKKQYMLASKYMREEKVLKITGSNGWKAITPWSLEGVDASFDMIAYSPMESNKAVKLEVMRSLMESFVNNPMIDQRNFFSELLRLLDMPATILADPKAVAAALAPPPGPGAAAVPPTPVPEDPNRVPLAPQVQKLADAQVNGVDGAMPTQPPAGAAGAAPA